MTRQGLINKLNEIVMENNSHDNGYHYEAVVKDWENYGKSRTYFSIIETRDHSKHYVTARYGYIDNQTGVYYPAIYANLEK